MISPLAFKIAVAYLIPYIYIVTQTGELDRQSLYLTTSYASIDAVTHVRRVDIEYKTWVLKTKLVRNATAQFILVDLPSAIGLCPFITIHAPSLWCKGGPHLNAHDLYSSLDPKLVQRAFGVPNFQYNNKAKFDEFIMSGFYDYAFMVQSFPSLAVTLKAPVTLRSGNDCGASDCSVPRVEDFFLDGARDTAVGLAVHMGSKYVMPKLIAKLDPWIGRPISRSREAFVSWYNRALYGEEVTARAFDAGVGAVQMSTFVGGGGSEGSSLLLGQQEIVKGTSHFDGLTWRTFYTPPDISPAATSLASASSGAISGVSDTVRSGGLIMSARAAGTAGWVNSGGMTRFASAPVLPVFSESSTVLRTMSQYTTDVLAGVSVPVAVPGGRATVQVIRSTGRNAWLKTLGGLARIPKRRRRQLSAINRGAALTLKGMGKALSVVPAWAYNTIAYSAPWIISGVVHLQTFDVTIQTIFPIQTLTSFEKFYIAAATLMFCQCFHDVSLRQTVLARDTNNTVYPIGRKNYTNADVVFDFEKGLPGDILHECSPMFGDQIRGLSPDILFEVLSVHFDTTYVVGSILFYNGPAKYIINDYVAYFNDVYPAFAPVDRNVSLQSLEDVLRYDTDFLRAKRSKRKTYVYSSNYPTPSYKRLVFDSESSYTISIQHLLDTPRLRYEYDIVKANHYNTSVSYYKDLAYFTDQNIMNPSAIHPASTFRIVKGITILEVMRGVNPFNIYIPRVNIIRELSSGYAMEADLVKLRSAAISAGVSLEYLPLTSLVGLYYLIQYPTDIEGYRKIASGAVERTIMGNIGTALYRMRYARIPILLVVQEGTDIDVLYNMFVMHVRVLDRIDTWKHYSPFMITDRLSLIPSASYSVCISKRAKQPGAGSLFDTGTSVPIGADSLFMDACDMASIHITYDKNIREILENDYLPDRIKSVLSLQSTSDYTPPSGGLYDPVLSELLNVIRPEHRSELEDGIKERKAEPEVHVTEESPLAMALVSRNVTVPPVGVFTRLAQVVERNMGHFIAMAVITTLLLLTSLFCGWRRPLKRRKNPRMAADCAEHLPLRQIKPDMDPAASMRLPMRL